MTTQKSSLTEADIIAATEILRGDEVALQYITLLIEYDLGGELNVPLLLALTNRPESDKSASVASLEAGGLIIDNDGRLMPTELGLAAVARLIE